VQKLELILAREKTFLEIYCIGSGKITGDETQKPEI
jgi:hypothetical protein